MKSVWRLFRNVLAAGSALLSIGLLLICIRSFFMLDRVSMWYYTVVEEPPQAQSVVSSSVDMNAYTLHGGLLLVRHEMLMPGRPQRNGQPGRWATDQNATRLASLPAKTRAYPSISFLSKNQEPIERQFGLDWLGYGKGLGGGEVMGLGPSSLHKPTRAVTIPLPLLIVLTAIGPAIWFRGWRRRRSLARRGFAVEPVEERSTEKADERVDSEGDDSAHQPDSRTAG